VPAINAWINTMISYCKNTLGDNHIYTVSIANAPGTSTFANETNIDFYTDHVYTDSINQDHQLNFMANRARILYGTKPYLLGEFGNGICANWTNSFISNNIYSMYQFHDAFPSPPSLRPSRDSAAIKALQLFLFHKL